MYRMPFNRRQTKNATSCSTITWCSWYRKNARSLDMARKWAKFRSFARPRRWLDVDHQAVITYRLSLYVEQESARMCSVTHDFRESLGWLGWCRRTRWWSLKTERSRKWSALGHPRRIFPISLKQRLSQRRSRAFANFSRRFTLLSPACCFATVDPCTTPLITTWSVLFETITSWRYLNERYP